MNLIVEILNWVSNSLLLPAIVILLGGILLSLVELGSFFSTYLLLLQQRRGRDEIMAELDAGNLQTEIPGRGIFARHLRMLADRNWDGIRCEKCIFDLEQKYEGELERAKFMIKLGPMLGLMCTLIPMGPALGALASGQIESMAYNMQIAFSTTVAGLLISGVGLLVHSVKRRWFTEEIAGLRYALELHLYGEVGE